ncbi:MAG: hypothetical protein Q9207_007325 [Kuettlingeria erythrocarpa]
MCQIEVLLYSCGHERFSRLALPCPAGLCQEHNECYEERTHIVRRRRIQSPPFCRACFDDEGTEIYEALVRAEEDLYLNHNLVRRYLHAVSGRVPDNEDQTRIRERLRKRHLADQELLEIDFYGPTRRIPDGSSAFIYDCPQRSFFSHGGCIEAYNLAGDDEPSEDGETQRSIEDDEVGRDDVEDLLQALDFMYEDSPHGNDEGEHFRRALQNHQARAQDADLLAGLDWLDSTWREAVEEFVEESEASFFGQDFSEPYWPPDTFTEDSEFPSMPRHMLGDNSTVQDSPPRPRSPESTASSQRSSTTTSTSSSASTVVAVRAPPAAHREIRVRREGPVLIFDSRALPNTSTNEPRSSSPSEDTPEPVNASSDHTPTLRRAPPVLTRRHSTYNTNEHSRQGTDQWIRGEDPEPLTTQDVPVDDETAELRIRGAASRTASEQLFLSLLRDLEEQRPGERSLPTQEGGPDRWTAPDEPSHNQRRRPGLQNGEATSRSFLDLLQRIREQESSDEAEDEW